jgi:hypothetical protein
MSGQGWIGKRLARYLTSKNGVYSLGWVMDSTERVHAAVECALYR